MLQQQGKTLKGLSKGASLMSQMIKILPAMQETQVPSLGQEDPLEKEIAIHSSILAWRIPWTEVGYSPGVHKESDTTEPLHFPFLSQILSHDGSCRGCMLDHVINTLKVFSDKTIKRKNGRKA